MVLHACRDDCGRVDDAREWGCGSPSSLEQIHSGGRMPKHEHEQGMTKEAMTGLDLHALGHDDREASCSRGNTTRTSDNDE